MYVHISMGWSENETYRKCETEKSKEQKVTQSVKSNWTEEDEYTIEENGKIILGPEILGNHNINTGKILLLKTIAN